MYSGKGRLVFPSFFLGSELPSSCSVPALFVKRLRLLKSTRGQQGHICCLVPSYKTGLFLPATWVNTQVYVTFVFQEALRYVNETTKQKEMLEFALNYLQTEDEVCCCTVGARLGRWHIYRKHWFRAAEWNNREITFKTVNRLGNVYACSISTQTSANISHHTSLLIPDQIRL